MKETLRKLLQECCPQVDFTSKSLVDDGLLTSLDLVSLVVELDDAFGVSITADDLVPENFNSVEAMQALIERLQFE